MSEQGDRPSEDLAAISPADQDIIAEMIRFSGDSGQVQAYLARPAKANSHPGVLLCHENRGLLPHFLDVARRLARVGYATLAVDVLSGEGGTAAVADPSQIPSLLSAMPREQIVGYFQDGLAHLQGRPDVDANRIGMVGFCFGGGITWRCATQLPELRAAVPFYGPNPPLEDVPAIQCAVMAIYGERDARINAGIPEITEAMAAHNKVFRTLIYPDAEHAFFNDTGQRYQAEAAAGAWQELLAWFGRYLK